MTARLDRARNIADLAALARRRLPPGLYEFIARGAEDEVTLRENAASIRRVLVRQRVGVDVSKRDISTTLFGTPVSMPIAIAVTGLASLVEHDGERKLARAAAAAGVPFTIGTSNMTAQADLKAILGPLLWRQMYPAKDRKLSDHHLAVTRELGIEVLQVTMDSPVVGNREYIARSGFAPHQTNWRTVLQVLGAPRWALGTLLRYMRSGGFPEFADMPAGQRKFLGGSFSWANTADDFTWDELAEVRRRWDGALVAKGVSTAEDARRAAACGVDGIIVSNHGGRSLDGAVGSMQALREVVDAVALKVTVLVDGGFVRGGDVLKAVALGASGAMVGRATMFGLAAGAEAGVARALAILREETDRALALFGAARLDELDRTFLNLSPAPPRH